MYRIFCIQGTNDSNQINNRSEVMKKGIANPIEQWNLWCCHWVFLLLLLLLHFWLNGFDNGLNHFLIVAAAAAAHIKFDFKNCIVPWMGKESKKRNPSRKNIVGATKCTVYDRLLIWLLLFLLKFNWITSYSSDFCCYWCSFCSLNKQYKFQFI